MEYYNYFVIHTILFSALRSKAFYLFHFLVIECQKKAFSVRFLKKSCSSYVESSIEDAGLIKEGEPDFFLLVDPSSLTIPFDHDQAVFKI